MDSPAWGSVSMTCLQHKRVHPQPDSSSKHHKLAKKAYSRRACWTQYAHLHAGLQYTESCIEPERQCQASGRLL